MHDVYVGLQVLHGAVHALQVFYTATKPFVHALWHIPFWLNGIVALHDVQLVAVIEQVKQFELHFKQLFYDA